MSDLTPSTASTASTPGVDTVGGRSPESANREHPAFSEGRLHPAQTEIRSTKYRLALLLPIYYALFVLSYAASTAMRFDFDVPEKFKFVFWNTLPLVIVVKFIACWATTEWRRTFRHVTVLDLVFVGLGTFGAASTLLLCNLALPVVAVIPRSILLMDAVLSLLLLTMLRFAYRTWKEILSPLIKSNARNRTLIYGVDSQSIGIYQMLTAMHSTCLPFRVVGFVSETADRHTSLIAGVQVYNPGEGWTSIASQSQACDLLIPGNYSGRIVRSILRECKAANINVHIIPTVDEMVGGRFRLAARDVTVSDLLRRDPNQLDMGAIKEYVTGRRVMVTGGAGSIGSELCRQLLDLNPELLLIYDQSEFGVFSIEQEFSKRPLASEQIRYFVSDILDQNSLHRVMSDFRPEIVFHAAAYKHVPLMEDNPQAAIKNNILGTKAVADAALMFGVQRFIQISTDKAVRPTSVMGATKLIAEKYVQSLSQQSHTRFITVRFGNVLNSMGSVVPTFRKQIETGGPITVTHPDMQRFFMTIPEAVQLVIQAGASGTSGDVLILDMGDPVKIVDLAKDIIILSGLRYPEDIDIEFTGLRPGEKLYEELFYETESGAQKIHDKIFRGNCQHPPLPFEMISQVAQLETAATSDTQTALSRLREVVLTHTGVEWNPSRWRKVA